MTPTLNPSSVGSSSMSSGQMGGKRRRSRSSRKSSRSSRKSSRKGGRKSRKSGRKTRRR